MILNGAKNGKDTGMILIDLQKAFNTLDHKKFYWTNEVHPFSDKTMKWFHSYLTNRAFFVSLDHVFSEAWYHELWNSSRIYIRTFIVFAIYINVIYCHIYP